MWGRGIHRPIACLYGYGQLRLSAPNCDLYHTTTLAKLDKNRTALPYLHRLEDIGAIAYVPTSLAILQMDAESPC